MKTGSVETRLEVMEQQVFKCQGMLERGLNANHMVITEFTSNHKMDAIDIGKHLSRLYDRVDQLQGQIYDPQNQNCEYEYRFKSIRFLTSVDWNVDFPMSSLSALPRIGLRNGGFLNLGLTRLLTDHGLLSIPPIFLWIIG
ncbi:40s ribosomal protein s5-1 [Hordeum vulgare]|nr:40s ribosomal protein s5-1 [Hordeum vulgare]